MTFHVNEKYSDLIDSEMKRRGLTSHAATLRWILIEHFENKQIRFWG